MATSDIVAKIRAEKNSNIDTLILEASNVEISNNIGLIIPVGTSLERGTSSRTGTIRYNSTDKAFEGYDGSNWGTLGGVKNVAQTTFIRAETSPGAGNNQLDFFTSGKQRMQIDSSGDFKFGDISDTNIKFFIDYETGDVSAIKIESQNIVSNQINVNNLLSTQNISAENIIPKTNNTYSLGDSNNKWKQIYLDNSGINIGNNANIIRKTDGNIILNNNEGNFTINGNLAITGNLTIPGQIESTGQIISNSTIIGTPIGINKTDDITTSIGREKALITSLDVSNNSLFQNNITIFKNKKIIFTSESGSDNTNLINGQFDILDVSSNSIFNSNLSINGNLEIKNGLAFNNNYGQPGEFLKSNGFNNACSWEKVSTSIFLSFPVTDKVLTKKTLVFPSPTVITKNNIIARLDNPPKRQQLYTFGKSIPKRWVAVGNGNNTIAYSNNGIDWIGLGKSIFSTTGCGVAWNGSMWVAVGEGTSHSIAYSYDGIEWEGAQAPNGVDSTNIFTKGNGVAWNGSIWVAVGEGSYSIATSSDGIIWVGVTGSTSKIIKGNAVASNGSMWVALGEMPQNSLMIYSYDGETWQNATRTWGGSGGLLEKGYDVAYNGSIWVAVGDSRYRCIIYSNDGKEWNDLPQEAGMARGLNILTHTNGIAWNGYMWIAVGKPQLAVYTNLNTGTIAYSYDGMYWFGLGDEIISDEAYGVAWNGSMWVAVGKGTNTIAYSYDGIEWEGARTPDGANTINIFTQGNGIAFNGLRENRIIFDSSLNLVIPEISMNTITLNESNNKLDFVNDNYFNNYQQFSLTITY